MYNLVSTLVPLFLIGSSSYLQVMRTIIISRTSSNFVQIRPRTEELAALECLKNSFTYLRTIQNIFMTCWLSGERLLPCGPLVLLLTLISTIQPLSCIKRGLAFVADN